MAEYITKEQARDAVYARIDELKADEEFNIVKEICISGVKKHIAAIPAADVLPIPEGATIGDVMKTIFPYEEVIETDGGCVYFGAKMRFDKDLWNAPYKKGVNE